MPFFRKTIYCEIEFIDRLFEKLENASFTNEDFHYLKYLNSLRTLLYCPYIKLYLNVSNDKYLDMVSTNKETYINKEKIGQTISGREQFLYDLETRRENSLIHVHCLSVFPQIVSSDECVLNSIFLTTMGPDQCMALRKRFGLTVFNIEDGGYSTGRINDKGDAIISERYSGWEEYIDLNEESNAMIIIDNYLLNNNEEIKENLEPILDKLLPEQLESVTYHITFIARFSNDRGSICIPVEPKLRLIKDILQRIRPKLKVDVTFIKTQKNFHDRTIILNNLWFGCGSGFIAFKKRKPAHTTSFNIVTPFLNESQEWCVKAYSNILHEVDQVMKKTTEYINDSFPCFYLGSKNNRLLETRKK